MNIGGRFWLEDKGKAFVGRGRVELLEKIRDNELGGRTMGKATTASTKNFQRQREKANQEASGKPRINNKSVVRVESRRLSSMARQSISLFFR